MRMEVAVDTSHGHTAPVERIAQRIYYGRAFVSALELVSHATGIRKELLLRTSGMSSPLLDLHDRIIPD